MLRRMLRVDNWPDVASLENVEEDHSFLFLKKNLMNFFFFFFLNLENLNFSKELRILNFFLEKFGNLEFLKEFEKKFDWWIFFLFFFLKKLEILNLLIYFLRKPRLWMRISLCELLISPCLVPVKRSFQLAMNWEYLPNTLSLGHIPCLDWTWVHLMLRPLGNMKEDHGPRSLVPSK